MVTLKINYNVKELEKDNLTEDDMLKVVREYAKENGIREVENGLFEKDGEHALCLLTKIPVFVLNLDEKEHEFKYYKSIILDEDGEIEDCIEGIKGWRKNEPLPKKDYEVIEEIEILREFAFGILADISRIIKKEKTLGNNTQILEILNTEIIDIYNNIFKIETLKDANICCGKLQIVNQLLKNINQ